MRSDEREEEEYLEYLSYLRRQEERRIEEAQEEECWINKLREAEYYRGVAEAYYAEAYQEYCKDQERHYLVTMIINMLRDHLDKA